MAENTNVIERMSTQEFDYEEKLITEVKKRPNLYKVTSKKYIDHTLKTNLWKEIEQEIGIPVDTLKKKWKSIRDYYTRNRKKLPTGSAAKRKCLDTQRMDSLRFLEGTYIMKNETLSNVSMHAADAEFQTQSSTAETPHELERQSEVIDDINCDNEYLQSYQDTPAVTDQNLIIGDEYDTVSEENPQSDALNDSPQTTGRRLTQKERFLKEFRSARNERTEVLKSLIEKDEDEIDVYLNLLQ